MALRRFGQRLQKLLRHREFGHRFGRRRMRERALTGLQAIDRRLFHRARFRPVMREHVGLRLDDR